MIKIVIILCILLLVILYIRTNRTEYLDYDENTYQTLEAQQKILNDLQNQYDNGVPEEDKITNDFDKRDRMLYLMNY